MKIPIAVTAGAVLMAFCAATHAEANILVNGSFESGLASWTTSGFALQGYDYGVDSGSHSGGSAFYGGAVGDLGFLRQTIATVAGQLYSVDFWLASDGYLPNRFLLSANAQPLLDVEDVLLQPYGAMHASFTASAASTQVSFGFRDDSGWLHLDDVTVSPVPEPGVGTLLACGLAAIAARRQWALRSRTNAVGGQLGQA